MRQPVRHEINLEPGWSESPGIFAGYHRERLVTSRLKEDMAEQTVWTARLGRLGLGSWKALAGVVVHIERICSAMFCSRGYAAPSAQAKLADVSSEVRIDEFENLASVSLSRWADAVTSNCSVMPSHAFFRHGAGLVHMVYLGTAQL